MEKTQYEQHIHSDPDFPFIFFEGWSTQHVPFQFLHWHTEIELLHFTSDSGIVFNNGQRLNCLSGNTVIIRPDALHTVCAAGDVVNFYCLIVDKAFTDRQKLPVSSLSFPGLILQDLYIEEVFRSLPDEVFGKPPFYKQEVQSQVTELLVYLCRQYPCDSAVQPENSSGQKEAIVKSVIEYLRLHFTEDIPREQLSRELGFSYYYLCHVFKEITTQTIGEYIQHLRCQYAMQLLATMSLSVSEAAEKAGFGNVSYFSKIYKRHMGRLPSEEPRTNA